MTAVPAPPQGTLPNRRCRGCGALLFFQAPPPPRWHPSLLIDRAWQRWATRVPLVVVLAGLSVLLFRENPWWLVPLALFALLLRIVRPRGWKPRCPRCGSFDIEAVTIESGTVP